MDSPDCNVPSEAPASRDAACDRETAKDSEAEWLVRTEPLSESDGSLLGTQAARRHDEVDGLRPVSTKRDRPPKPAPEEAQLRLFRIARKAVRKIESTIGRLEEESGGVLIGDPETLTVSDLIFDKESYRRRQSSVYQPDVAFLDKALGGANGEILGMCHSHPRGLTAPTTPDLFAAWSNITSPKNPHLRCFLLPIVQSSYRGGRFEFHPYIVTCHPEGRGRVVLCRPELLIL